MFLKCGIQPFWFWNGDMRDDEIKRQIKEMSDKGIRGFFIHPRQGLAVPYLSKEWFNKVGVAIDEAKKRGLEVWLYDEYPYPSGVSGGLVVLDHPEFEAKALKIRSFDVEGPKTVHMELPWGQILLARAYPGEHDSIIWNNPTELSHYIGTGYKENIFQMSGLTRYNRKRFFTGRPIKKLHWDAPRGRWHVCIISQVAVDNFKYFGKYVDPLNPDAVRYYINTTHEQYKKYFGHEFGRTIKGIFTDEITAFPPEMPWSPLLPQMFERKNGYPLVDRLPALFERMGGDTDKVRYDYWNTVTDAFIESYEVQVRNWCEANNLLYAGEKPILRSKQLKYFHIPGIDAGHQKAGTEPDIASPKYRANAKLVSSAAHFYGKPGALCECFHSIGWGMALQDMKWTFDWLAVQGINFFVPHAFFYTTDGLTKHDAPPSSFYQMPWWSHMGLLSDYVAQITDIAGKGRRKVDMIILDPASSHWTAMGEKKHLKERLEKGFSNLQRVLLQNHFDYYIMDPELFSQCDITHGRIRFDDEEYKVLILPPMLNMEDCALKKLKEYIEGGGIVIGVECLPVERIGDLDADLMFSRWLGVDVRCIYGRYVGDEIMMDGGRDYSGNMIEGDVCGHNESHDIPITITGIDAQKRQIFFAKDAEEVVKIVEKVIERPVSVVEDREEAGQGDRGLNLFSGNAYAPQQKDILTACYETEDELNCFLVNTSGRRHRVRIHINYDRFLYPRIFCSDPGLKGSESVLKFDEDTRLKGLSLEFAPYQAYILRLKEGYNGETDKQCAVRGCAKEIKVDLNDGWEVQPMGMNALRLGHWWLKIGDGQEEKPVECKPIIDQIHDAGIALPIRLRDYFGCPKQLELPPLSCLYKAEFLVEDGVEPPVLLVMEPGSIQGDWHISVNGKEMDCDCFMQQEIYMPTNLVADISHYIKQGLNEIQVKVAIHASHDGLVNPLYLFGYFGVEKEDGKWKLGPVSNIGRPGDLTAIGLPFYAGTVIYRKKVFIDGADDAIEIFIDDATIEDVITLHFNGHNAGTRAWRPYRWRVGKSWIKPGQNEVELHATNTLIRLFEGQYFDVNSGTYVDV